MNLRSRLLVAFIAIAILVVILFGAVAYRIAADSGLRKEADLLQHAVQEQAATLAARDAQAPRALLPVQPIARCFTIAFSKRST